MSIDNQKLNISRRQVLQVGAMSGFALATYPLHAATIITSKDGLSEGFVNIGADKTPAYRAYPKNNIKDAGVIVVASEIFGAHEHIQDVCRRLARLGYYAIAPEYFHRIGNPRKAENFQVLLKEIIAKTPDATVFEDTDAAYEFATNEGASATKHAITGFCWGGRIVWLYSSRKSNPNLKAGIAWYGRLVDKNTEPNPLQPIYPIDEIVNLNAPVLGLYGGKDQGITLDDIEFVEDEISTHKKKAKFIVYPEAGHAFNADYRKSYHEASAKDGWQKMISWLKENGM